MNFSIQPVLENEHIRLSPLHESDFDALYQAAADPKIWEQHPNPDRWKKEAFQNFFEGAMTSQGAFKITDRTTEEVIGSSRYYDYNPADNSVFIGYTFYKTAYWGKGVNPMVKKQMLTYIFQFVDTLYFHVGAENIRSQIAMERLGAKKVKEEVVAYFNEASRLNFVYAIDKSMFI